MGWTWVVVAMVSDGLDLGGRGSGVYGTCSFGPGWSGLRCLWCLGQCGRAMVSMVSDGLDLGGRWCLRCLGAVGLWCLWCLLVLICVVGLWCLRCLLVLICVVGLWRLLVLICVVGLWCLWCLWRLDQGGRSMVSIVSAGLGLGVWGYGVCWVGPGWSGLWCLRCLG